jgi:plasmid replication initiation protein
MESKNEEKSLTEIRSYKVVKANDLIQKSRFDLQLQEQKIILYLISKIKPEDMELKEHIFEIQDFCKVCGLAPDNGANYIYIKQTLKDLRDKSIWIMLENGKERTLSWFDYVEMDKNSGAVTIKISDMMKPYLLHLKDRFTQYELLYTLAMNSQYSLRLYELLKSYEFQNKKVFDIDELKLRLSAENYARFPDFKRNVLDIALREINNLSDITVKYGIIKEGRRFAKVEFSMKLKKDLTERLKTWAKIDLLISPMQMTLYEKIYNKKPDLKDEK